MSGRAALIVVLVLVAAVPGASWALDPASEAEAMARLTSRRVEERIDACATLAGVANGEAIRRLDRLARTDPSRDVRAAACRALSTAPGAVAREAVSDLVSRSESKDLRLAVVAAVAEAGPAALGYLYLALGDPEATVRARAVKGIGAWATARFVPTLAGVLGDPDTYVRLEAVRGILDMVSREPSPGTTGAGPSAGLPLPLSPEVQALSHEDLTAAAQDMFRGRLKDSSSMVRFAALRGLMTLDARGLDEVLGRAMGDEDHEVRVAAGEALMRRSPDVARDAVRRLARHGNPQVRVDALERCKPLGTRAVEELLLFIDDHDDVIRRRAVEILGGLGSPGVFPRLADLLADTDEEVRRRAAVALGRSGQATMARRLGTALRDSSAAVRRAAVESVAAVGGPDALVVLRGAAGDDEPSVRQAYIDALASIGGEEGAESLVDLLFDPALPFGEQVENALRRLRDASVRPLVARLGAAERLPLVRSRLLRLVGDLRAREAVAPVSAFLSSEDPTARAESVEALTRIGDPTALPALERYFIDHPHLSDREERDLRTAISSLGRSSLLSLQLSRHVVELVLALVGVVVVLAGLRWYGRAAAAERRRREGAGASPAAELPASLAEVVQDSEAHIRSSRDTAGLSFFRRGLVLFSQGNMVEAKRDLDEALRLCPRDVQPHVLFVLGRIFEVRGDVSYAFRLYTQALRIRDKGLLGDLMSQIAAESPNDVEGNILRIAAHLPYHGPVTVGRILGTEPWDELPESSSSRRGPEGAAESSSPSSSSSPSPFPSFGATVEAVEVADYVDLPEGEDVEEADVVGEAVGEEEKREEEKREEEREDSERPDGGRRAAVRRAPWEDEDEQPASLRVVIRPGSGGGGGGGASS